MHMETRCTGFFVWPQNQGQWFILVWPENHSLGLPGFCGLASKPLTRASRFGPQNWPQNQWEDEDGVGHASRSSGLHRLEASQARVSQSSLKIDRGTTWVVHVASS
jgi:hypothetical protein